jgi:hypothetical protein
VHVRENFTSLLRRHLCRYLVLCPAYSTEEGAASDYLTLRATVAADARLQDIPDHNELLQVRAPPPRVLDSSRF